MQQNHFALSWIHCSCCFNVELAKASCIPSLPYFFWTNTVGKVRGVLFTIDLGQQFGFSSTQQLLPSSVCLWNVICQPHLVWLSALPFCSWFWLFRKYLFGTIDNCHAGLNHAASLHRACIWCGCKWVTDLSLCFSSILASALPGYL